MEQIKEDLCELKVRLSVLEAKNEASKEALELARNSLSRNGILSVVTVVISIVSVIIAFIRK